MEWWPTVGQRILLNLYRNLSSRSYMKWTQKLGYRRNFDHERRNWKQIIPAKRAFRLCSFSASEWYARVLGLQAQLRELVWMCAYVHGSRVIQERVKLEMKLENKNKKKKSLKHKIYAYILRLLLLVLLVAVALGSLVI